MVQWLVDGTSHTSGSWGFPCSHLCLCVTCAEDFLHSFPGGFQELHRDEARRKRSPKGPHGEWSGHKWWRNRTSTRICLIPKKQLWSNKNGAKSGNSIIAERLIDSCRASGKKLSCFLLLLCLLCYSHHFLLFVMLFFSPFCIFAK